jgi:hypothetical protein
VNKTAQFEYRIYSKQITIYSSQNFQYLVLKKINTHILFKIKNFNMDHSMEKQIEVLNPTNLKWIYLEKKNLRPKYNYYV